jgi:hypothetical protein
MAGIFLTGLSLLAKLIRKDHALIVFDAGDRKRFAQALKRVIWTRASAMGRGDDITALLFVGGSLVTYAFVAPAPRKETAPEITIERQPPREPEADDEGVVSLGTPA